MYSKLDLFNDIKITINAQLFISPTSQRWRAENLAKILGLVI